MSKKKKDKKEDKKKHSKEDKKKVKKPKKKDEKKKGKKKKEHKSTSIVAKKTIVRVVAKKGTPGRKRISSIVDSKGADISLHHNAKIAVSRLRRLNTVSGINNFIKGDTRGTVLKVAELVKARL